MKKIFSGAAQSLPLGRWGYFSDPLLEAKFVRENWPGERRNIARNILLISVLQLLFSLAVITEYGVDWRFFTDLKMRTLAFLVWLYPLWLTRRNEPPAHFNTVLYAAALFQVLVLLWVCAFVIIGALEYTANVLLFVLVTAWLFARSPKYLAAVLLIEFVAFLYLYHGIHSQLEYWRTAEFSALLSVLGVVSAVYRVASERRSYLTYRLLQQQEKLNLIALERQRLAQDMHDSLGAQLIGALVGLQSGQLNVRDAEQIVQECIDDMRLIIDAISPTDGDLLASLGNLRYRVEPRLRQLGIGLFWKLGSLPELISIPPDRVLHVLRIMQEAITNIIKHAQAHSVVISLEVLPSGEFCMEIADDGVGAPAQLRPDVKTNQYGMANMLHRAEFLRGHLSVTPNPTRGLTVRLVFPLEIPN